MDKEWSDQLY